MNQSSPSSRADNKQIVLAALREIDRRLSDNDGPGADAIFDSLAKLPDIWQDRDIRSEYDFRVASRAYRNLAFLTAIDFCERVLEHSPVHVGARTIRALAYSESDRLEHAADELRTLLDDEPAASRARLALADVYSRLGDERAVTEVLREASPQFQDHPYLEVCLATSLLRQRRWSEAWPHYERRFDVAKLIPDHAIRYSDGSPVPRWRDGQQPLCLTIIAEQGPGDAITFASLLPRLNLDGPPVRFCVPDHLAPMMSTLDKRIAVCGYSGVFEPRSREHWAPLLDLLRLLKIDPTTHRQSSPYLSPTINSSQERGGPLSVGIVWQANPKFPHRSIPLKALDPIICDERFRCTSLQHGNGVSQVDDYLHRRRLLIPDRDKLEGRSFIESLHLLCEIDVLLTVDTSIAHYAGATGMDVILMLPFNRADWRWPRVAGLSNWYPHVHCVYQDAINDWNSAVIGAAKQLVQIAEQIHRRHLTESVSA